jgi:hypothetical protein
MSATSIDRRLRRLEGAAVPWGPDACPDPRPGAVIDEGDPLPPDDQIHPCAVCGGLHVLEMVVEVVEAEAP